MNRGIKSIFCVMLVVTLIFAMSSCNNSNGKNKEAVPKTATITYSNGTIETAVYETDNEGRKTKQTINQNDEAESWSTFEYDAKGNMIKQTNYEKDGSVLDYTVYEYDDNSNKIKDVWYLNDSSQTSIYEYDNDKLIKVSIYDANGAFARYVLYTYKDDLVEKTCFYNAQDTLTYEVNFEYDKKGRKIKETITIDSGNDIVITSEYDSKGNVIKETCVNGSGEEIYIATYTY